MSKRKENSSDTSYLKKARMMTEHTLMSFKSKNSILTEKEETEQKSTELEIVTELNLLLDHLTNENVDCVDKFMKVVGKYSTSVIGVGSKHEKRRAESVRYTSMCLQSIFSFLMRNSKSLSALVHERLKKVFDSFAKIDDVSSVKLSELFDMFASHTIAMNEIDPRIQTVISSLALKMLTKAKLSLLHNTHKVHSMFFQILSSCTLSEKLLLQLLDMLNQMFYSKSDPSKAKLLLNVIFGQICQQTGSVEEMDTVLQDQKCFSKDWTLFNIQELIDSSMAVVCNYLPEMRSVVFEKSIEYVIFAKRSLYAP